MIALSFPFSLGLRQSGLHWIVSARIIRGVGRKWKRSDSSDSDSVILMTLNTTGIFDFHKVMSALTTSLTIPTPTPSLVKTSVKPECLPINLTNTDSNSKANSPLHVVFNANSSIPRLPHYSFQYYKPLSIKLSPVAKVLAESDCEFFPLKRRQICAHLTCM